MSRIPRDEAPVHSYAARRAKAVQRRKRDVLRASAEIYNHKITGERRIMQPFWLAKDWP
jgi:hypothetical protein